MANSLAPSGSPPVCPGINPEETGAQVVVLIPAYNPDSLLVQLVEDLSASGFQRIVVVNDGSAAECLPVFDRLGRVEDCHVVHHAANLGKGRALKSGFNYTYLRFPDAAGIVTVDADGQHLAQDICKVAEEFMAHPRALVIGGRTFSKGTPLRSLVGNLATRYVFRLLVSGSLSDTQSGLRCFPLDLVPQLMALAGERYEYEMNMLVFAGRQRIDLREVGITTVYLENNRSSHFNPLIDSMKIYFLLLRFGFSSLLAAGIDFLVFAAIYWLRSDILTALVVARVVSGGVNFLINKSLVFHDEEKSARPFFKYLALFLVLAMLSFMSIKALAGIGVNVVVAKVLAESVLFLASFTIQRDFIFVSPTAESEG